MEPFSILSSRFRILSTTDFDSTRKYQKLGGGAISRATDFWTFLKPKMGGIQKNRLAIVLLLASMTIIVLQESRNRGLRQVVSDRDKEIEKLILESKNNNNKYSSDTFGSVDIPQISDLPEMQIAMESIVGVGDSANRPLWQKWMPTENDKRWRQRRFRGRGARDLIQFSGYRLGPKKIWSCPIGRLKTSKSSSFTKM